MENSTWRSGNVTFAQKMSLVELLTGNPKLLQGKFTNDYTKKDNNRDWDEIADALNSDEHGPQKTSLQWRKFWTDIKSKTKTKFAKMNKLRRQTGGGPPSESQLSVFEESVLSLVNQVTIEGDTGIEESYAPFHDNGTPFRDHSRDRNTYSDDSEEEECLDNKSENYFTAHSTDNRDSVSNLNEVSHLAFAYWITDDDDHTIQENKENVENTTPNNIKNNSSVNPRKRKYKQHPVKPAERLATAAEENIEIQKDQLKIQKEQLKLKCEEIKLKREALDFVKDKNDTCIIS